LVAAAGDADLMSAIVAELASYVPALLLEGLADRPLVAGVRERIDAVVLCADVAGSTSVGEALARQGSIGAETLSQMLNGAIGAVVDAVHAHGGQVGKFSGDGLLALWPIASEGVAAAAQQAAQCGWAIQAALAQPCDTGASAWSHLPLTLRVGIDVGEVWVALAPTADGRFETLIVGTGVVAAASLCARARPGTVCVGADVRRSLGNFGSTEDIANGVEAWTLTALGAREKLKAEPQRHAAGLEIEHVRCLVPPAILAAVLAEQELWLAQLRRVSALFINAGPAAAVDPAIAMAAAAVVSDVVARYDGTVARIGSDEKGLVALAVFGLAANTHDDDPARAVGAALESNARLAGAGLRAGIGVATGRAFCGALGSRTAREYTVIGDVINVAARLMQAADDGVLCDAETAAGVGDPISFEPLAAMSMRGRAEAVLALRPQRGPGRRVRRGRPMIGRQRELQELERCLTEVVADGTGRMVIVEGEAGIGKSILVAECVAAAAANSLRVITVAGDPIQGAVPYAAWNGVLEELLRCDGAYKDALQECSPADRQAGFHEADDEAKQAALWDLVRGSGDDDWWHSRLPLLSGLGGAAKDVVAWEGEARAGETHEALLRLVEVAARQRTILLVFEDAHWMDSASWLVCRLASERWNRVMTVLAMRPPGANLTPDIRQLWASPKVMRLPLRGLPADEAEELARRDLDPRGLAEPIVAMILARAAGHPLFIEELARTFSGGTEASAPAAQSIERLANGLWTSEPPASVEAVVAARIDTLSAAEQQTLMVASVLGAKFSFAALQSVMMLRGAGDSLSGRLRILCEAGLLRPATETGEFEFRHAVSRDVAYGVMAHAQRCDIHVAVAQWLEANATVDNPAAVSRLAYHWSEAAHVDPVHTPKALQYLERAGEMAAERYANREAALFFSELLALVGSQAESLSDESIVASRQAGWHRRIGEACFGLGQLQRARFHLELALDLSPYGRPRTRAAMMLALGRGIVEQLVRRISSSLWHKAPPPDQRAHLVEAAQAYNFLQMIAFIEMDQLAAVHASVRAANLAEAAGPCRPLVYATGGLGMLVGMVSRHLFERYNARAHAIADAIDDPVATLGPWFMRGYLHMRSGEWADAEAGFRHAQAVAKRVGDQRFWEMAEMQIGCVQHCRGRIRESLAHYDNAEASARLRGDIDAQSLALVGTVTALAPMGRNEEGLAVLARIDEWLGPNLESLRDRGIKINALGMRALLLWRSGEVDAALASAEEAAVLIATSPVFAHYALPGYAAVAEVALAAQITSGQKRRRRSAKLVRDAAHGLKRFARVFPFARSQVLLWRGVEAANQDRRRQARRLWLEALRHAHALDLLYDEGRLHARLSALGGPDAGAHRAAADACFAAAGASGAS